MILKTGTFLKKYHHNLLGHLEFVQVEKGIPQQIHKVQPLAFEPYSDYVYSKYICIAKLHFRSIVTLHIIRVLFKCTVLYFVNLLKDSFFPLAQIQDDLENG